MAGDARFARTPDQAARRRGRTMGIGAFGLFTGRTGATARDDSEFRAGVLTGFA
jgi:hypothetical protein